ncbi:hypothetical protein SAMN05216328_12827 [Ensifer sp. YR511]|nr:hypothetical protein SAMN05216328_12827 [Ensifer sp. YR511]
MEGHTYKGVSNGRINATKLLRRAAASRVARVTKATTRVASKGGRSVKIEVAGVLLFQEFPT